MDETEARTDRWAALPEQIRFEDMTTSHPVEPGQDSTPDVDLVRYWAVQNG